MLGVRPPENLEATLVAHGATNAVVWRLSETWAALVPRQNVHGAAAFRDAIAGLSGILIREDLTLVSVIGRSLSASPSILPIARDVLQRLGIEVHGQAIEPGQVGFLVDISVADKAVAALHSAVIDMNSSGHAAD